MAANGTSAGLPVVTPSFLLDVESVFVELRCHTPEKPSDQVAPLVVESGGITFALLPQRAQI